MTMYAIYRDRQPVAVTPDPLKWFHRNLSYSMDHATKHEGYRVIELQPDERDWQIIRERVERMDALEGPRVGDFVIFVDGITRRISQLWDAYEYDGEHHPATVQTSDGGSWHLCRSGHVSFSGSLYTSIPQETLTLTDERRLGDIWIFHHDHWTAHNGVTGFVEFGVYRCSLPANTP